MALSAKEIARQAAEWAARVHAGDMSAEEEARLEVWLAADRRHLGAYGRVEATLARLERLSSIGADSMRAASGRGSFAFLAMPMRRRLVLSGSIAASLVLAAITVSTGFITHRTDTEAQPQVFATRLGEQRSVTLADGSVATLNTNSRIVVRYLASVRQIHLEQGEVLFKVAKNKERPFIVAAGDTIVRAVGTAFSVRVLPRHPVQVLVQEGVVEVSRGGVSPVSPVRVVARTQTVVPTDAPIVVQSVSPPEVARGLAWETGHIAFAGKTLNDAAAEFARYNTIKIMVDPAVANVTITGLFASNDPVGFAKSAARVNNLHVEVDGQEVWIIR
jgi:transmembrane sensor